MGHNFSFNFSLSGVPPRWQHMGLLGDLESALIFKEITWWYMYINLCTVCMNSEEILNVWETNTWERMEMCILSAQGRQI